MHQKNEKKGKLVRKLSVPHTVLRSGLKFCKTWRKTYLSVHGFEISDLTL